MMQFIIIKRAGTKKLRRQLIFTITRPQNGQMLGINDGKTQLHVTCRKQRSLLKMNFIKNDANIVNYLSHFLTGYLKTLIKSHRSKT